MTGTTAGAIVIWICARNRVRIWTRSGRVCPDDLNADTGRERPGSPGLCRPRCAGGRVAHAPLCFPSRLLRAARPAQGAGRQRCGHRRKYRQL